MIVNPTNLVFYVWGGESCSRLHQGLASETGEERTAHLQQSRQQETKAVERVAERSNQLHQDRDYHRHHRTIDS